MMFKFNGIEKAEVKHIFLLILPICLAIFIASWVNLQLFQDGAAYLYQLQQTRAVAIMNQRFGALLVQTPILLSLKLLSFSSVEDVVPLMRFLFCLGYGLLPLICLLLSWQVVQNATKRLLIWPWLIIVFVNLVNFSWVSEILIALQLSCPLLLGVISVPLHPTTKPSKWLWSLILSLSFVIFWLHSLVIFIFATATVGMVGLSICPPVPISAIADGTPTVQASLQQFYWRMAMFFGGVTIARMAWAIATLNSYERSFLEAHQRNHYLFAASTEERLFLLISIIIGGLCIVAKYLNHKPKAVSRLYAFAMGGAIAAASIVVVHYDHSPFVLKTGLSIGVMLVLLLLMCLDAVPQPNRDLSDHPRQDSQARETRLRQRLMMTVSCIFLIVMLTQSFLWTTAVYRLRAVMVASPTACMDRYSSEFDWLYQGSYTMLNNWTLPILALLQGDRAMPTVLIADNCQGYENNEIVDLYPWGDTPKAKLRPQL